MSALIQGSPEWLSLRKSKITATDAPIIMGLSPWKTPLQIYNEKIDPDFQTPVNSAMQRGTDLEPMARKEFAFMVGYMLEPEVVVKDWQMASMDGYCSKRKIAVEIKCPGPKVHHMAMMGKVPEYYYPQMQHQMHVCDLDQMYYYSFDGKDGVFIIVYRDDSFIKDMVEKERIFYECLINKTPPEDTKKKYTLKDDEVWEKIADEYVSVSRDLKFLQEREKELRDNLIRMSDGEDCKGAGVSVCKIERKGSVDYSRIPELKKIDLDVYRKDAITSWRITSV